MTQIAESLSKNLKNDGHQVHKIQLGKGLHGLIPYPKLYLEFIKVISKTDIVHIISASGNALLFKDLPAILFSRILNKKVILNFVGGSAIDHFEDWIWIKKIPFRLANAVVLPTNILKDAINKKKSPYNLIKIPHVVDIKYFKKEKKVKENKLILLATKALEIYSGYEILIDIFSEVKNEIEQVELWIIGDGPLREKLSAKVKNMNLESVRFLGNVSHDRIPEIMSRANIFVHTTMYESFGIALVEAMASSLPIVTFDVGGISEVLGNESSYLIPYNDKERFLQRVMSLISNPKLRDKLGKHGKQQSQKFSWDIIGHHWYALYSKL